MLTPGDRQDILLREPKLERENLRRRVAKEQPAVGDRDPRARGGHQSSDCLLQLRAFLRDLLQVLGA